MNSLEFLYTIYFISLFFLGVGVFLNIIFIIPLQVKQARVANGLALLRRLMLAQGFLNLAVGIVAILSLTSRYFIDGYLIRYVTVSLILIFSICFFIFTMIWVIMYKQQFTPDQKRLHAKIARQEIEENK